MAYHCAPVPLYNPTDSATIDSHSNARVVTPISSESHFVICSVSSSVVCWDSSTEMARVPRISVRFYALWHISPSRTSLAKSLYNIPLQHESFADREDRPTALGLLSCSQRLHGSSGRAWEGN